ncbi:cytochrome P450 [Nocardioides sp. YIM 152315]|uniref:cytochrome P450 n=1 Tax=Nocardioides sp. YIM 152315 TaxID=3031760 RepID=UPI0023D97F50|nr:cytochrome P450 [Nocardioides sp. YIM 152315]MDF1605399.1 cytochrome P450 [Nocardioides sp. YIM 152315]
MTGDLAAQLLRRGYLALPHEHRQHGGADVFGSSVLGRRAVVVRGREGARLFYDTSVVERAGAIPAPLANLLFGRGAVHGTDGATHASRKRMFLDLLDEDRVADLATTIGRDLERRAAGWSGREVVVFDELVEVYGAAVQAWAGIIAGPAQTRRTSRRLAAVVDGFGGAGAAYPKAWLARWWIDRRARRLVAQARSGWPEARPGSVVAELATGPGAGLDARLAGVELVNILRPTVAVAWAGTFLARDLHAYPQWRALLDDPEHRVEFGHEVRRTCPFVPALAGRAVRRAQIADTTVEPGDLIVLDVPGTNRDPDHWAEAERFLPERFAGVMPDPFAFVPQGGGDPTTGHRCPGETLTVRILSETARVLAGVDYEPVTDTAHDPTRIPTLPARGLPVRVS